MNDERLEIAMANEAEDARLYPRMDWKTEVEGWVVSTTKLPIDHGWDENPVWYETMVFRDAPEATLGTEWKDYQRRYVSIVHAERGHADVVSKLRNGEALDDP